MAKKSLLILACIMFFLTGCAGVGIVATNDPLTKLNDADHLFKRQNRPLPAERLIREAIEIYKEKNDALGLGHAYREYAELLRSSSVKRYEKTYRRYGFQNKSITFDNRNEKSKDFLHKAIGYYSKSEKKFSELGEFDSLTNVYYYTAWSYFMLEQRENSCAFFDKSMAAYFENIRRNPSAKPYTGSSKTIPELIKSHKQGIGCK